MSSLSSRRLYRVNNTSSSVHSSSSSNGHSVMGLINRNKMKKSNKLLAQLFCSSNHYHNHYDDSIYNNNNSINDNDYDTFNYKNVTKYKPLKWKVFGVNAKLPNGTWRQLIGQSGQTISQVAMPLVKEYQIENPNYYLVVDSNESSDGFGSASGSGSSSMVVLDHNAQAFLIEGEDIIISDGVMMNDVNLKKIINQFEDNRIQIGIDDPRLEIVEKLLITESEFQSKIKSLKQLYEKPLRKLLCLTPDEHRLLFDWIDPLCSMSSLLQSKLQKALTSWDTQQTKIGAIFSKQLWSQYDDYISRNYSSAISILREKQQNQDEFVVICKLRQGAAKHSISDLIQSPLDRIGQYDNYLQQLVTKTHTDHPDYSDLCRAANKAKTMVKRSDSRQDESDLERIQDLFPSDNLRLNDADPLSPRKGLLRSKSLAASRLHRALSGGGKTKDQITSNHSSGDNQTNGFNRINRSTTDNSGDNHIHRCFIMDGPVVFTMGVQSQDRHLFLFNDLLLIAKSRSSGNYKLKEKVRVSEMWLSKTSLEDVCELSKTTMTSFVIGWPTTNVVATFSTPQAKELWFERLQQCINKSKEKEGKTSTTIQISYWDQLVHEEKYTLIKVGNRDTIHQTIKLALEDLKLCDGEDQLKPCDPSDYQLWVKTSKDDTPYPLIGHEYPFSIKMNFVRDLLYRSNLDLHNFNNIAADNKCIFILRKNGKSLINSNSNNENSKAMKLPKKTKRSAINWMAIKSRMTLKSESSIDSGVNSEPTTPTKGKLFGQHLDLLCSGGSLPNPIMNMLKVLFEKGPFTVGIFRKSANARVCKEFRAKLESDPDADVTDVPVMVISSVFKEFLRSLPDCLLQSSLYPKWIEAISIENNLECRSKMSQLLSELPTSNLLLLRHFLCTLWYIAQRSPINKMCSVNLGVCVGQSMLTPHPIGSPNIQLPSTQRCEEMSKQVPKIIAYLIDHCPDLMGESTLNLFGLPPGQEDVHHHQVLRQNDSGAEESDSLNSLPDHGVGSNITTSSSGGNRRDDSSIDSLERALFDDGTNGSPSNKTSNFGTSNKMSLSNLSRDSGLTLSDTQLYSPEDEDEGSRSPCKEESPLGYPFLTKSVPHLDSAGLDSSINVTFSYGRSAGVSIDGSCHDVVRKRRHHNGLMANEIPNYFNQKHNHNQNHYNHNQRNRYSSPIQSHQQQQHQHYNQHNHNHHNHHIPIHYSKSYSYGINGDDVTDSVNVNREYRYRRPPLAAVLGGAPQAQQVNYDNYLRRSNSEESLVRPFDDQVNYQLTSLPIQSNYYEPATTQTTKSQTTYYQPTRINQINERVNSICSSETQSQRSSISKQSTGSLRSNPLGIHPPSYQQAMNRKEMIARSVGQISLRKTSSASSASGNSNQNHIYEESVRIYQQDIQSLTNQTHRAVPVRVKTFDSDEENEPNKINIMNMNMNGVVNHTVNLVNGHHKPQLQRVASEGTTLKPGPRVVRISSAQTMNPHQFISNSHSFVHPSHHSHQQSQNHQINVLQRSAKDFIEEEWRKDIHCSVARLRTIFNANNSNLNQQQNQVTIKQGVRQGSVLINENQNQFNNKLSSVSSVNKLEPTGPCVTVVHVTSSDQTDCHCNGTKSIITVHRRDSIENSSSEEESYV